jgi:hypothetical protein
VSRRRVWSETLPLASLARPETLAILARYRVELIAAVRPDDLDGVPALLRASSDAGVRVGLWPMLRDDDGRWVSARNAQSFDAFVAALLDACRGWPLPAEIAFDLEPPIGLVSQIFSSMRTRSPHAARFGASLSIVRDSLAATIARVTSLGIEATAAVVPMVLFDAPEGAHAPWQRAMGTPVDGLRWSHVSAMAYTSIFEGWSRGSLRRVDALSLLATCCMLARARYGAAAGISLGAVDTGALGDEPIYRSPSELAEDVAIATSCGIDDLTLFDFAGALRRSPAESWLDAFTAPAARLEVPSTMRARALVRATRLVGALPW